MERSGASIIVDRLAKHLAKYAFLVPGKAIDSLVQSLAHSDRLTGIMVTSELSAGYMAEGYARASGNLGVCMTTGGPGASNVLTAAIDARLESSRVLFITGDIPATDRGLGYFHDSSAAGTRSVELFQQAVGYSRAIADPDDLLPELDAALLNTPAHLAIGADLQTHLYPITALVPSIEAVATGTRLLTLTSSGLFASKVETIRFDRQETTMRALANRSRINVMLPPVESLGDRLARILNSRPRTIVLVGGRAIEHGRADELLDFVETYHLPVATTISAKGAIPETHPLSLGTFGYGGNQRANTVLTSDDVDTLLLVGLDFNQNESLEWDPRLVAKPRQVIRIERLPRQFPPRVNIDLELIVDDCAGALQELTAQSQHQLQNLRQTIPQRLDWLAQIRAIPWHWSIEPETCFFDRCVPLDELIRFLQSRMPDRTMLCADAGAARLFAGHSWISHDPSSFFASSQLAPMGWAIAAGIGIQLAHPDRRTIVLAGDGSMMMHGLEIVTAVRYQLPILFVICNNRGYGTIYQRLKSDVVAMNDFTLLPAINWVQFANSLGVKASQISSLVELDEAIEIALADRCPYVLEVLTPLTHLID